MSDIDTYLTQIFGKIDRPGNIPTSLNSIKLFLKGMRQIFEQIDNESYIGSAEITHMRTIHGDNFIIETSKHLLKQSAFVKESVFSASNFDNFNLRETSVHPECMIALAQAIMAAYKTMIETNGKAPGSYEVLVRKILDKPTDDKHIKTLKRVLGLCFTKDTGKSVVLSGFGLIVAELVAERALAIVNGENPKDPVKVKLYTINSLKIKVAAAEAKVAEAEAAVAGEDDGSADAAREELARVEGELKALERESASGVRSTSTKYKKMAGGAVTDLKQILERHGFNEAAYNAMSIQDQQIELGRLLFAYIDSLDSLNPNFLTSYNIDKALSSILKPVPPTISNFFNDETTGRNFVRKSDGKSSILYEIKNGKETIVNEDQITRGIKHESAGVKSSDKTKRQFHEISEYYSQCLTGTLKESEGRCFEIDFVSAPNDLDNMDVSTLKLIRKQFQIPSEDVIDEVSGSRVTKLKGYDEWLKVVEASVEDAQKLKTIKGNNSLRTYIEILISYFNTHLQILNPGYKVDVDISTFLNRQSPLGLAKILYRANNISIISKYSQADLINIARQAEYSLSSLNSQNSLNGIQGGGSGDINLPNLINPVAELLRSQMFEIVRSLNAMGKKILPEDYKEIENKLNDLQSREGKLIQLYKYISEYHDLLRLKGPQTDSALILSIDNLKKFIDLYKEKQSKVLQKQLQSTSLMEAVTKVL